MDETIAWLQERPYYSGQLETHRVVSGSDASSRAVDLPDRLDRALDKQGITDLYDHQAAAIEAVRGGDNVVLATPTASGKSLAYTVPAVERALADGETTLYVAPQVALINDQEETLSAVARSLGFGTTVTVDQYTGRLSKQEKRAVRDRRPTLVLTTPDMLHYGLLPHSRRLWDWLFENLSTVVLDEVHEYRGVFGSHVGLVMRRLARMCREFGADPQYVCCSATIDNPIEHAATVTGQSPASFTLVDDDASATGPTHWLFWNPPADGGGHGSRRSSHTETKRLFVDLVSRGYQTAVFTRARQTAERYATDSARDLRERGEGDLADGIAAYQAALSNDRREELEAGLNDGTVRGVWSTKALELGVDIGGLDAVLLDGYPGTRMATYQQAGRAGRGQEPSLVALVAGEDQLDQYVMAHPEEFFEGDPERAVADPHNDQLLPAHIRAGATESWLRPSDDAHFGESFPSHVATLTDEGELERRQTGDGLRWFDASDGSPQHEMSLRSIDDREITLIDASRDERIGGLSLGDALRDAHTGAIYHHQGTTYEVADLDLRRDLATLRPTRANHYTQVRHEKTMVIDDDRDEKQLSTCADVTVRFADVTMYKQITGFERRDSRSGEVLGREELDVPETSLETRALYFTVPTDLKQQLLAADGSFPGAIHAAEHAMIALFPLLVVCDRRDIGGLSTPMHPHTDRSTIFIYDGYPGGVGLSRAGYDDIEELMAETTSMLVDCPCSDGCPACVQSPHCGNGNDPLDKALARKLLGTVLSAD
ncbi:DEAD/DEAH box helicase [Halovenus salina]|uniref:DEAD/DEAH box helicase n=1 Tax=Halovenus salina TaxID=1510225 RepID=UPI002260D14A|nr:DEAD/DEAH box helicase [Halovenus salina]